MDAVIRFIIYVAAGIAMAVIGLFIIFNPSDFPLDNQYPVLLILFGGAMVTLWLANSLR